MPFIPFHSRTKNVWLLFLHLTVWYQTLDLSIRANR
jgi:hypothetical protein